MFRGAGSFSCSEPIPSLDLTRFRRTSSAPSALDLAAGPIIPYGWAVLTLVRRVSSDDVQGWPVP